jgi:hypothetical protein
MASSQFLVSPLSLDEQAAHLREWLSAKKLSLSQEKAVGVCAALALAVGGEKTELARKLGIEMRRRSFKVNHASCVEIVARMCGGESWMRMRQALLAQAAATGQLSRYFVQFAQPGGDDDGRFFPCESLADAGSLILEFAQQLVPTEVVPSVCSIQVTQTMLGLEFQHPTAPWLTVRVMKSPTSATSIEPLLFDDEEVRTFCTRVQRSLEMTHGGLLVMGAERSASLATTYMLLPKLHQPSTGFSHVCQTPMELYVWLGSFELEYPKEALPVGLLAARNGTVHLTPRWVNATDGTESLADNNPSLGEDLVKRLMRLRRTTGMTLTEFFSSIISGPGQAATSHQFNRERLAERMAMAGASVGSVAERSGLSVNEVLRAQRYGYGTPGVVQKLADAVGLASPNDLLPDDEQSSVGIRIETGEVFLRGLKDSHMWRFVMGDSLAGEELETAKNITESLKEYVELFQFGQVPMFRDPELDKSEPVDEKTISGYIQELLDELNGMGLVVLVGRGLRFMPSFDQTDGAGPMAMLTGTICVERESYLRKPEGFKVHND